MAAVVRGEQVRIADACVEISSSCLKQQPDASRATLSLDSFSAIRGVSDHPTPPSPPSHAEPAGHLAAEATAASRGQNRNLPPARAPPNPSREWDGLQFEILGLQLVDQATGDDGLEASAWAASGTSAAASMQSEGSGSDKKKSERAGRRNGRAREAEGRASSGKMAGLPPAALPPLLSSACNHLRPFGIKVRMDWMLPHGATRQKPAARAWGGGVGEVEPFQPFFRVSGDPLELAVQPAVLLVLCVKILGQSWASLDVSFLRSQFVISEGHARPTFFEYCDLI